MCFFGDFPFFSSLLSIRPSSSLSLVGVAAVIYMSYIYIYQTRYIIHAPFQHERLFLAVLVFLIFLGQLHSVSFHNSFNLFLSGLFVVFSYPVRW